MQISGEFGSTVFILSYHIRYYLIGGDYNEIWKCPWPRESLTIWEMHLIVDFRKYCILSFLRTPIHEFIDTYHKLSLGEYTSIISTLAALVCFIITGSRDD